MDFWGRAIENVAQNVIRQKAPASSREFCMMLLHLRSTSPLAEEESDHQTRLVWFKAEVGF